MIKILPGEQGAQGPQGPKGDKGDKGDPGEAGAQGPPGKDDVLPLDSLFIDGDYLSGWTGKSDEREARISTRGAHGDFTLYVKIKPQGTSSLSYEKKNFTLNLYTDDTYKTKAPILIVPEWGAQSKYVIKANWIDATHSCNITSARLAAKMQARYGLFPDAPNRGLVDGFPVMLHFNGMSQGLYTLNIPKDAWQFGMEKSNPNHIMLACETQTGSGAFRDAVPEVDGQDWTIEAGPVTPETWAKFKRMHTFVRTSGDADFTRDFAQYLNLDACLNYYVFACYASAIDNLAKNMLIATYDGEVWFPSLYDLDSLWGLQWDGLATISPFRKCPEEYDCPNSLLWEKLVRCFPNELADRFNELHDALLNPSTVISETRKFIMGIDARCYEEDARKWPGSSEMVRSIETLCTNLKYRDPYASFLLRNLSGVADGRNGKLLYELPGAFAGNSAAQKYIDTKTRLLDDPDRTFTLIAKVKRPDALGGDGIYFSLFSEEYPTPGYRGIMARNTYGSLGKIAIVVGDNYGLEYDRTAPDATTVVIRKISSRLWDVMVDGAYVQRQLMLPEIAPYMGNLLIGCQEMPDGSKMRYSDTTTYNMEVYNTALTDANVRAILDSWG